MFADDTILFSYTKEGLQKLLNKLNVYCDQWNITVNVDKTLAMVFKQGNRIDNSKLFYNNKQLINVKTFTYLETDHICISITIHRRNANIVEFLPRFSFKIMLQWLKRCCGAKCSLTI